MTTPEGQWLEAGPRESDLEAENAELRGAIAFCFTRHPVSEVLRLYYAPDQCERILREAMDQPRRASVVSPGGPQRG